MHRNRTGTYRTIKTTAILGCEGPWNFIAKRGWRNRSLDGLGVIEYVTTSANRGVLVETLGDPKFSWEAKYHGPVEGAELGEIKSVYSKQLWVDAGPGFSFPSPYFEK